jgi:hypothetical protein
MARRNEGTAGIGMVIGAMWKSWHCGQKPKTEGHYANAK